MGVYAITGSASGMGKATAEVLREAGHTVIGVDLRDADVIADLSTPAGRTSAIEGILKQSAGKLTGLVLAAGLGPVAGRERLIAEVNFNGAVDLLEGLRPALAETGNAKVVVFSSNSTTTVPAVPKGAIKAFLARDVDKAIKATRIFKDNAAAMVYASSKIALSIWLRRAAVTPEWAGKGIRLNAIAPGAIYTPLIQAQLDDPKTAGAIEDFPVPIGGFGDARKIGETVAFMLSDSADFMTGSILFMDGGTDAWFRADDWPKPLGLTKVGAYMKRQKEFTAFKAAVGR